MNKIIYSNKKPEINCVTAMIATEIRSAIQKWRKDNRLPINYRIPTLKVYFTEDIIKTAIIEGITDMSSKDTHFFEMCLIDKVEFEEINLDEKHDFYFWSGLGGTMGVCDVLKNNSKVVQDAVDTTLEKKYYNEYL